MLGAVVIIFREVIEAAFIFSLLLALTHKLRLSRYWSIVALLAGLIGSWLASHYAYIINQSLDGSGQELVNCLLLLGMIFGIIFLGIMISPQAFPTQNHLPNASKTVIVNSITAHRRLWLHSVFILTITSAITREGSEIWIYLSSVGDDTANVYPILLGSAIGAGIGLSLGALAYYIFIFIPNRIFYTVFWLAITLMIGGLATQIARELMQIGYLESGPPLWDSSWLLNEHSLAGEFLHALLSYEAKPTKIQAIFFVSAITPMSIALIRQLLIRHSNSQ